MTPTLLKLQEEIEEKFDERFRPIDFCHVGENKLTYVEYTRDDIKSLIRSATQEAYEAGRKVEREELIKMLENLIYLLLSHPSTEEVPTNTKGK